MWNKKAKKNAQGFMLLELLLGIFILIVGVAGIHGFISRFFVYNRFLTSKMTAAYLTQEGIEIVRNVRDTNWVEGNTWDEGIFCCESSPGNCSSAPCECNECEADYDDVQLSQSSGYKMDVDGNGFFYHSGSPGATDFKRVIKVRRDNSEYIEVCVTTSWEGGEVKACDKLYNWYGG